MANWTPKEGKNSHQPFQPRPPIYQATEFDGKRLRKAIARKTVDYNSSIVNMLENRIWTKNHLDRRVIQPDFGYYPQLLPPMSLIDNPVNCVTTKFVRTSTNKMRCPIFCVLWTPEGRRLVTGASSGEFTLWNGLTFNFETILQAHDTAVRAMVWSSNDMWMVTADQGGYVKYWQSNMNNVKMFHAHDDPIRGVSMSPSGNKFATCSDDGTIKIWDFFSCCEDRVLRGHGSDVKAVDWHPEYDLIVSGSKDSQQPIKLWDSRSGTNLATIHAHKSTVMDVKWNQNGNWLLTASRDHLIKIFDIRNVTTEMQIFRGHKKEACCLAWHPVHESLFASGGSDGSILFWLVGTEKEVGGMELAHDSVVWSLSWHPLGHILASGSNDHTCKFWTRNRPGDRMGDKYNLNIMPKGQEEVEYEDVDAYPSIPGITRGDNEEDNFPEEMIMNKSIPGLGLPVESNNETKTDEGEGQPNQQRKVPFSKPVPKMFENQWSDRKSHPVIAPPNDIDRQYNTDHHHHHINSNSSHPPHPPSSQPPNGPHQPPYMHGPPPLGPPSHQFPPGPPHPMDHPMDGHMGYPGGPPPGHGPMHGPGPSGPGMPPGGPMPPPHMRRDDMGRGNDYHYNMHNDRFHHMPPPHSMPPHHPKDKYSHRNQHPPSHSPPPMGGPMYNDMPGPDYHRRDMRWREDDYRGRDEDFRRHNYEPRGPGCEPPWRRPPPPPPDEFHWRPNYPPNDVRWRRDMRGNPNDQRWDWDRSGPEHHRQIHH